MRERLTINCFTADEFELYVKDYPLFNSRWLKKQTTITSVLEGYLDDPAYFAFYEYLRSKIQYKFSYITRRYSPSELADAELLSLWIEPTFEPTGEELGTKYVYPCQTCKSRRVVEDKLILNEKKIPPKKDIAKSIARDEWVISARLAALMEKESISGARLQSVFHYRRKDIISPNWFHLVINSIVKVDQQTKLGDPFRPNIDLKSKILSCGHAAADIVFSELFVKRNSWDGSDIVLTDLAFGGEMNLIHPYNHPLISQRFYRLLLQNNMKGFHVEVAHLV